MFLKSKQEVRMGGERAQIPHNSTTHRQHTMILIVGDNQSHSGRVVRQTTGCIEILILAPAMLPKRAQMRARFDIQHHHTQLGAADNAMGGKLGIILQWFLAVRGIQELDAVRRKA